MRERWWWILPAIACVVCGAAYGVTFGRHNAGQPITASEVGLGAFVAVWLFLAFASWRVIARRETTQQLVRPLGYGARAWASAWAWTLAIVGSVRDTSNLTVSYLSSRSFLIDLVTRLLAALPIALWGAYVMLLVSTLTRRRR